MRKLIYLFVIIFLFSGCSNKVTKTTTSNKPIIYTTIYPIQFIVESLIGTHVNVKTLIPTGGRCAHF